MVEETANDTQEARDLLLLELNQMLDHFISLSAAPLLPTQSLCVYKSTRFSWMMELGSCHFLQLIQSSLLDHVVSNFCGLESRLVAGVTIQLLEVLLLRKI